MREQLRSIIEGSDSDWHVAYCGDDPEAATAVARQSPFDCAVVDLDLGLRDRADPIATLASLHCPIVIVSAGGDAEELQRAMRHGVLAFVAKHGDLADLRSAIEHAQVGRVLVSPDLAAKLAVPRLPDVDLSEEGRRALTLRASGMSDAAIATALGCSPDDALRRVQAAVDCYRFPMR